MRYDPTEYLYVSARVRAMEGRLIGREKWNALPDMSEDEIGRAIERGEIDSPGEETLLEAFDALSHSLPDPTLIRFLQYPYDCHNLKVLEKCRAKDENAAPLLSRLGSVPTEQLLSPPSAGLSSLLPTHLAAAVTDAREAFAKTGDPRQIDLIFDRAVFADMSEAVTDIPFAAAWLARKADLINLTTCLRLLQMGGGELGRALLQSAALPAGTLDKEHLLSLYDGGEDAFFEALQKTDFERIFVRGERLADAERRADDDLMTLVRHARTVAFGADVPLAYLLALEAQCKNLRILIACLHAGLDRDTISSRMRESYV